MFVVGPRILVRPEASNTTSSFIEVVEYNPEMSRIATVVGVGTGDIQRDGTRRPLNVKVGDRVLLNKNSGVQVEIGGEPLLFVPNEDVVATVTE